MLQLVASSRCVHVMPYYCDVRFLMFKQHTVDTRTVDTHTVDTQTVDTHTVDTRNIAQ